MATALTAPAPSYLAGITNVLGGANANHPFSCTVTEPFQITNNQFSLNLVEFQLDKVPDEASPPGYRFAFGWGQAANGVNSTDPGGLGFGTIPEGRLPFLWIPVGRGLQ